MTKRVFQKGQLREIQLANGQILFGKHSEMERRWERIHIIIADPLNCNFVAYYSRTTGKVCESYIATMSDNYRLLITKSILLITG